MKIKKYIDFINESITEYRYGCVMIDVPVKNWNEITQFIDSDDVYTVSGNDTYGIQDRPHLTLLYGTHKEVEPKQVESLLKDIKPFSIEIDGVDIFENEDYDVVKFNIKKSDTLQSMFDRLSSLPNSNKFKDYKPHITIAYVKKGTGKKYIKPDYKWKVDNIDEITYSMIDGNEYKFSLNNLNESFAVDDTQDIQHHYSIYDWFEDLKSMQWSRKSINKSELKKWTEHFIGAGWYDKISKKVDHIFDSIRGVDIDYINDRMLDVWDELPTEKDKYVMSCVAYGDYENFNKEIDYRYNGLISVMSPQNDDRKLDVIIHIIKEIIYPTMYIGSPSIWLRRKPEQEYVIDKKWNCENFNIDNYEFEDGQEFDNGGTSRRSTTTIFKYELEKRKDYNVDKVIQMYKPCVVIEVGGHHYSHRTGKIKLSHLEPLLDSVLETILPTLDYEAVIWDKSRGKRQFTDDEFYDYTLKIILK